MIFSMDQSNTMNSTAMVCWEEVDVGGVIIILVVVLVVLVLALGVIICARESPFVIVVIVLFMEGSIQWYPRGGGGVVGLELMEVERYIGGYWPDLEEEDEEDDLR